MKLAEALILRADAQKRIAQLRERLNRSAKVQEGEQPPENPQELLAELSRTVAEFTDLVKRINRTNASTLFEAGKTLTDVLAERDALGTERSALQGMINAAIGAEVPQMYNYRMTRSEIKFFPTINVAETQRRVDDLARQHRELDSRIQAANWNVDLLD
jgi:hypothetical protein